MTKVDASVIDSRFGADGDENVEVSLWRGYRASDSSVGLASGTSSGASGAQTVTLTPSAPEADQTASTAPVLEVTLDSAAVEAHLVCGAVVHYAKP